MVNTLMVLVPIVIIAIVVWNYRRKVAAREAASAERMKNLPVHILHGQRDWMFPVDMAREAAQHFTSAGAAVTYRELDDLSHSYGVDLSSMIMDWLLA